ncbi:hypothetical protein [Brazilian marseillevirus]|uniref:hypothetical protein n=1 Tax=Brazilian marseillevirus TaxID=1813599 RepID=UPI0007818A34|nr:hypothetical protein A3303_gp303 [Brazilian marseillevirus]AMQ10811.1 hypothetical protein [Brazilian marseillevirus]
MRRTTSIPRATRPRIATAPTIAPMIAPITIPAVSPGVKPPPPSSVEQKLLEKRVDKTALSLSFEGKVSLRALKEMTNTLSRMVSLTDESLKKMANANDTLASLSL